VDRELAVGESTPQLPLEPAPVGMVVAHPALEHRVARIARGLDLAAPYAVAMAYRVRFYMDMNAREALHLIELRTAPQGHPSYRRVCQQMHKAISDVAGHRAIADAMQFADHSTVELERLQAERAMESKRRAREDGQP